MARLSDADFFTDNDSNESTGMQELKQDYVYRRMTQPVLDAQYNIRLQVPDFPELFESWMARSAAVRAALGKNAHIDLAYGDAPSQNLDLFLCGQANKPLVVFIHGGYWRAQDKSEFCYVAEPFVADGINVAVINYRLAPHVTMDELVSDVRESLAWLYRNAATYGFDADRIVVTGSSAGGHLTVMSIITDWAARGLPRDLVKGGLALSGLYDLEPIRLCYLNKEIGLDAETAKRNSPMLTIPSSAPPLLLSVGGIESGEFHRQERDFAAAWRDAGLRCEVIRQADGHHFDMIEFLIDRDGALYRGLKELTNI
jgi:arylformamidase